MVICQRVIFQPALKVKIYDTEDGTKQMFGGLNHQGWVQVEKVKESEGSH